MSIVSLSLPCEHVLLSYCWKKNFLETSFRIWVVLKIKHPGRFFLQIHYRGLITHFPPFWPDTRFRHIKIYNELFLPQYWKKSE